MNWIVKNKVVIIVGGVSLIVGFLLNKWANGISEQRIINALKAEIAAIKKRTQV
jgi:hypothetical protein